MSTLNGSTVSAEPEKEKSSLNKDKMDRVRRVFGDSVMDDDDSFFMYTPSPAKQEDSQPGDIFGKTDITPINRASVDSTKPLLTKSVLNFDSDKENERDVNAVQASGTPKIHTPVLGYSQRAGLNRQSRASVSSQMMKKTQEAVDKAALSVQRSAGAAETGKDSTSAVEKTATKQRIEWQKDLTEAKDFQEEMKRTRFEGLRLQRQLASEASKAKAGFHQVLRDCKLQCIEEESQFKSSVHRDHTEALRQERERRRRESEATRAQVRANARIGVERLQKEQQLMDERISAERKAASDATRKTRREEAEQRRKSFQFRSGDAQRIRDICAKMRAEKLDEQHKSYDLERKAAKDVDEYRKQVGKERRECMIQRGVDSRKAKEVEKQRVMESQDQDTKLWELERAAARDVANAKVEAARKQQKELAEMRAVAMANRKQLEKKHTQEREQIHQSYEMERAGTKDVDDYRKKLAQQKRESMVFRGQEFVRQREITSKSQAHDKEQEHEYFEMKRDAEKDVQKYLADEREERRKSMAGRNEERSHHAKVMKELEQVAREKEAESYVLKWAGEKDVQEYERKIKQERKESLEQRGKESVRIRKQEVEERQQELQSAHEDEVLRSNDAKDVEEYRRKCVQRDRASLQYRGKEATKQRLQKREGQMAERKIEESNCELETMARKDVEDYVAVCKQRRRYSLAFRAKEKRRHIQWKKDQEKQQRLNQTAEIRARLMDQQYLELSRQQEQAARTLEAIQHQQRLFEKKARNPFQDLFK